MYSGLKYWDQACTTPLCKFVTETALASPRCSDDADHPAIPVQAFITLIAPEVRPDDPRIDELTAQFTAELERVAPPRPTVEAIPLRMVL